MTMTTHTTYSKQIFRTSSCKSVPEDRCVGTDFYKQQDSGTSARKIIHPTTTTSTNTTTIINRTTAHIDKKTKISLKVEYVENEDNESDSNDSVFLSGSSIDSKIEYRDRGNNDICDIYLGGSCMKRTKWRKEIAIPMMTQKEISYCLPINNDCVHNSKTNGDITLNSEQNNENSEAKPSCSAQTYEKSNKQINSKNNVEKSFINSANTKFNLNILDGCRILLFVITNETRSLAPMTLAAHYIGLGYNIVLCVQMLPDFCIMGNEKVLINHISIYEYIKNTFFFI